MITGLARGRRLAEPEGMDIRPTTDRVKEGLFSAIQFEIEGRRVLDLFAGTGQLGIECLSRGAESVVFTDSSPKAVAVVRENLRRAGLENASVRIVRTDAAAFLARTRERFGLIFLDPPYESALLERTFHDIAAFDILEPYGIIAAEHPAADRLPGLPSALSVRRTYRYGKIAVTLLERRKTDKPERRNTEESPEVRNADELQRRNADEPPRSRNQNEMPVRMRSP